MDLKGGQINVISVNGFSHPSCWGCATPKVLLFASWGTSAQNMRQNTWDENGMLNCDSSSGIQTWPGVFLTHHVLLGADCIQPWASSTHVRESRGGKSGLAWHHQPTNQEKAAVRSWPCTTFSILTHRGKWCVIAEKKRILWPKPKRKKKLVSDRLLLLSLF